MCTTIIKQQAEKGKLHTANNFVYLPLTNKLFCFFFWNE